MINMNNVETQIIQLHGAQNIRSLLNGRPQGATLIAVNRFKCGSIFYKIENGIIFGCYNENGWTQAKQGTIEQLNKDLNVASFLLVNIEVLQKELEIEDHKENAVHSKAKLMQQDVLSRIELVTLRRDDEGLNNGYWQGQIDALEVVGKLFDKYKMIG